MKDTLVEGQHLFIEKLGYTFGNPSRGDIIVFIENKYPENYFDRISVFFTDVRDIFKPAERKTNVRMVKRVIGTPGDEVDIRDGKVYVNGKELAEEYARGVTFQRNSRCRSGLRKMNTSYWVITGKSARTAGHSVP